MDIGLYIFISVGQCFTLDMCDNDNVLKASILAMFPVFQTLFPTNYKYPHESTSEFHLKLLGGPGQPNYLLLNCFRFSSGVRNPAGLWGDKYCFNLALLSVFLPFVECEHPEYFKPPSVISDSLCSLVIIIVFNRVLVLVHPPYCPIVKSRCACRPSWYGSVIEP